MTEGKSITLFKVAKELNIGIATIVDFLGKHGMPIEPKPTTKLDSNMYVALLNEFQKDKKLREEATQVIIGKVRKDDVEHLQKEEELPIQESEEILIKSATSFKEPSEEIVLPGIKVIGKIDLDKSKKKPTGKIESPPEKEIKIPKEVPKEEIVPVVSIIPKQEEKSIEAPILEPVIAKEEAPQLPVEEVAIVAKEEVKVPEDFVIRARAEKLTGPSVVGRIELPVENRKKKEPQPIASSTGATDSKKKRKRKEKPAGQHTSTGTNTPPPANRPNTATTPYHHNNNKHNKYHKPNPNVRADVPKEELSDKEIQEQIKVTLAQLSGAGKSGKFAQRSKLRRQKRDNVALSAEEAAMEQELQSKVLKVTEFVTANELANMMDVPVNKVIGTCMSLGIFVSINQRLDAEILALVAEEFGYTVDFIKPDAQENILEEEDNEDNLLPRPPIVTIMGHVDHGKTSLLDFIRSANVIAGEAGGITQHIGAYEVELTNGKEITFLDTPGHEAFTAMRARGAQVTDIVVIVIAADDSVMPQTKEAINHAQAAGVPIVFAFNKMDKPGANADKIREQLSTMNILVEEWGGKYQTQEISAKKGTNVNELLDKVLLESEMLDLKANPNKRATGTVIEAKLDKGRGIVTTILVQAGTLRVGDAILAGCYSGKVKALSNERGQRVEEAGPSTPVQVLGLQGAPAAGDKFNALDSEVEAREIANKRMQLQREQGMRAKKHVTLDEIGRRLAIGNFKELNLIVKGDVDGSIEALSDSLLKLSTEEIQINIISKSVGQISESDVLLASASDAIIIGFQVRPSASARKLAEQEQIDIRLYSIIYDAINSVKQAMEGMLAPEFEEKIVANVEIRETFKITKVGTIAGCMVLDGKITRNSKVRIVRDGVVVYSGELASLKRFKDDAKEVATGYECGLNIKNFNDIAVGDIVEAYEQVEIKRTL